MLWFLQTYPGSGIAEQPLGRVDGSRELCAYRAEKWSHAVPLAWLMGQRCEMLFSLGRICSVNCAVRAMSNIFIYFYHTGKKSAPWFVLPPQRPEQANGMSWFTGLLTGHSALWVVVCSATH